MRNRCKTQWTRFSSEGIENTVRLGLTTNGLRLHKPFARLKSQEPAGRGSGSSSGISCEIVFEGFEGLKHAFDDFLVSRKKHIRAAFVQAVEGRFIQRSGLDDAPGAELIDDQFNESDLIAGEGFVFQILDDRDDGSKCSECYSLRLAPSSCGFP